MLIPGRYVGFDPRPALVFDLANVFYLASDARNFINESTGVEPEDLEARPAFVDSGLDAPLTGVQRGLPGLDLDEGHALDIANIVEAIEDQLVHWGADEAGLLEVEPLGELGEQWGDVFLDLPRSRRCGWS